MEVNYEFIKGSSLLYNLPEESITDPEESDPSSQYNDIYYSMEDEDEVRIQKMIRSHYKRKIITEFNDMISVIVHTFRKLLGTRYPPLLTAR